MLCRATPDGWAMVESSDKMWFSGEGNGKLLQYSCPENHMNSMKRQKDRTQEDELPRLVGAQLWQIRGEITSERMNMNPCGDVDLLNYNLLFDHVALA